MSDEQVVPEESQRRKVSWIKWGCGITAVVLIVVVSCLYVGVRIWLSMELRKRLSPEEYEAMERRFNEPVDLPEEWLREPRFSEELVREAQDVHDLFDMYGSKAFNYSAMERMQKGETVTPGEVQQLAQSLEEFEPFTDALIAHANRPDYAIDADPRTVTGPFGTTSPKYHSAQFTSKLLYARAYVLAEHDRWAETFEANLAAHRLAKRAVSSTLITHLFGIAIQDAASTCTQNLAGRCNDAGVLATALTKLNRIAPEVSLDCLENGVMLDQIATLREAKQQGFPVELVSGKPAGYYFRMVFDYQAWKAKRMRGQPGMQFLPRSWYTRLSVMKALGLYPQYIKLMYAGMGSGSANPNLDNARIREQVAQTRFDLARLTVASNIAYLETGEFPETAGDLTPNWLPEEPQDPFAEKPYTWNPQLNSFYGIGPDRVHEKPMVSYSPSNGTVSSGSIFPLMSRAE